MTDDVETLQEKIKALEVEVAKARLLALKEAHAAAWSNLHKVWGGSFYDGVQMATVSISHLVDQARNELYFAELNRDS